MRTYFFRFVIFAFCISLPINFLGQQVSVQQNQPLNFWDIRKTLVFRSQQRESDAEINERLVRIVRQRKVNFLLSDDEEKSLKKAGDSDLLIETIRESLPKNLEELLVLYNKYVENYKGDLKQQKTAIEAAKEFVEKYKADKESKYGNEKELKQIFEYFKETIQSLED